MRWDFAPVDDDLVLEVTPFAELPLNRRGRAPRINVIAHALGRLFAGTENDGLIYEITGGGPGRLWFDVAEAIARATGRTLDGYQTWHSGLRSIAFHPDFATNGLFYTSLLEQRPGDPSRHHYVSDVFPGETPIAADSVVVEWQADPVSLVVDTRSYREVLRVGMPVYDHTIKQIGFNPHARADSADYGLLYVPHGDGSVKSATTGGGQRKDARGKILRIDPRAQTNGAPYRIPADNPFVGSSTMLPEVYSLGHRNPHHLAFLSNGMIVTAEPGRDNIEEINIVEPGANYGWSLREGTYVLKPEAGLLTGIDTLPVNDADFGFTYPAVQYGHVGALGGEFIGISIGGGYETANGSALDGRYFYCEFATLGEIYFSTLAELSATVRRGAPGDLKQAPMHRVSIRYDHDANPATPPIAHPSMSPIVKADPKFDASEGASRTDIRFGQGPDGTLFLMSKRNQMIYRVSNSAPGG